MFLLLLFCLGFSLVGGWGGESAAAPTGKSFRACKSERAGGRCARDQLRLPTVGEFAGWSLSSSGRPLLLAFGGFFCQNKLYFVIPHPCKKVEQRCRNTLS